MKVKIYVLYNPTTCTIRYIGRTKQTLKKRLSNHICRARIKDKRKLSSNYSYKNNWINSLLKNGIRPKIKLLTFIEGWEKSHKFEKMLIQKHLKKHRLVNGDDRGPGSFAKNTDPEIEEQRILKLKEHFNKENNKENFYNEIRAYDAQTGLLVKTYKSSKFACLELDISNTKLSNHRVRFDKYKQNVNPIKGFYFSHEKFNIHPLKGKLKYQKNRNRIKITTPTEVLIFNSSQSLMDSGLLNHWDLFQYGKSKLTKRMVSFLENNKIEFS